MSHEALPIDVPAFIRAIQDLPVDALHSRAAEIQNSIAHLKSSNDQMVPFADDGDQDCKDAMFENLVVIGRMNERTALLRAEVEKRGMRWADAEVEDADAHTNMTDNSSRLVNGGSSGPPATSVLNTSTEQVSSRAAGSLTDEELLERLQERLHDTEGGDADGVHL